MDNAFLNVPNIGTTRNGNNKAISNKPVPLQNSNIQSSNINKAARLPEMERTNVRTRTGVQTQREPNSVMIEAKTDNKRRRYPKRSSNERGFSPISNETGDNTFTSSTDVEFQANEMNLHENAMYVWPIDYSIFAENIGSAYNNIETLVLRGMASTMNMANRYSNNTKEVDVEDLRAYFKRTLALHALFTQTVTFGTRSELPIAGSKTQNYSTESVNQAYVARDPVPKINYTKQWMEDLYLFSSIQKLIIWLQQPFTTNPIGYGPVIAFCYGTSYTNLIRIDGTDKDGKLTKHYVSPINLDRNALGNYIIEESDAIKATDTHQAIAASQLMNNSTLDMNIKPDKLPKFSADKHSISSMMSYEATKHNGTKSVSDIRDIDEGSIIDMHPQSAQNLWWLTHVKFNYNGDNHYGIIKPDVLPAYSGLSDSTDEITKHYPWLTKKVLENRFKDSDGEKYTKLQYAIINTFQKDDGTLSYDQDFTNLYVVTPKKYASKKATDLFMKASNGKDRAIIGNRKVFFGDKLEYITNPDFVTSNLVINQNFLTELAYSTFKDLLKF